MKTLIQIHPHSILTRFPVFCAIQLTLSLRYVQHVVFPSATAALMTITTFYSPLNRSRLVSGKLKPCCDKPRIRRVKLACYPPRIDLLPSTPLVWSRILELSHDNK